MSYRRPPFRMHAPVQTRTISLIFLAIIALAICAKLGVTFAGGCCDHDGSMKALRGSGYTDITLGKYDFFSCGQGDAFSTHFKAKNPLGQVVEGTVCCGLLKSCTIRF